MTEQSSKRRKKHIIINAFDMACSGLQSPGLWKHPEDQSRNYNSIEYWTNLAKLLEKGKFNALFIADVLGGYDVYNGPKNIEAAAKSGAQWPVNDPSAVVAAMAAVTKNLSFAVTFSTISEAPYHFTRRLATLDHLTNGRVGWNIVSSYLESAARNLLNNQPLPPHDERYARAQEYLEVVYQLFLSSWADDAVKLDKKTGVFSDPSRIREINYEGKYFEVPGPNITEPTPQRLPVILQAGASKAGLEFAARNAEAVFIGGFTPEVLKYKIEELKKLAVNYGRDPSEIKTFQLVTAIVAKTHDEAVAKYQEYQKYGDPEGAQALFGGWTGIDLSKYGWDEELSSVESNAIKSFADSWTKKLPGEPEGLRKTRGYLSERLRVGGSGVVFYGSPEEVADEIETWVNVSGVDGFNFTYAISPGTFEDLVELLIPELRRRGLVWDDYPKEKLTFRENLYGIDREEPTYLTETHPAYNLRWRAGETKEEFEEKLKKTIEEKFTF
ncbi:luciferase-like domain-containing protein [Scheffersomyces amazonensis]|uniref:luciferase-like domain-containing protein n=1 Tax=Scheffersomyces amazonensis TaxID=1078765 RepID=UPI00315DBE5D